MRVDFDQIRAHLGEGELRCELAMAYDPKARTTDVLGENLERGYPARATPHINGTADIVVIRPRALVCDIKTGRRVADSASNWQLRALAVAVAAAYQVDSVVGSIAYLNRDGSWFFDECEWSLFDLAEFADILEAKAADWSLAEEVPDFVLPTPSPEACRWCPCVCSARIQGEVAA